MSDRCTAFSRGQVWRRATGLPSRLSRFPQWSGAIALTLLVLVLGACDQDEKPAASVYRVAMAPGESAEQLRQRFEPLLEHIGARTGLGLELVIPDDYAHLLELFRTKQIDIARFGGLTFVHAHLRHGAVPMVFRDIDVHFRSYFLTAADDSGQSLEDFAGTRFAFGSELSTSGHLMPRYFMMRADITPESHFDAITYTGADDRTAQLVRDGTVDLGVANGAIIDSMFADGRLSRNDVRIAWKSPPYPDYVWASQSDLPPAVRDRLMMAFLELDRSDAAHATILAAMNAGGYLPSRARDFRELFDAAQALDML